MGAGLIKTLVCFTFIVIGYLLQRKLTDKDQTKGVKVIILSLALPATIFIALLKIEIQWNLLVLPIIALAVNLLIFASVSLYNRWYQIENDSAKGRTLKMLLASMAPGLSCFPFIIEYLGEKPLAYAALTDVGNKIYGLIILYVLAMHWYYQRLDTDSGKRSIKQKVGELVKTLLKEPINVVLIVGLILLGFGQSFPNLPVYLQEVISRLSSIMTPLVLLFIGLSVSVKGKEAWEIVSMLFWKSGIAFLLSGIILVFLGKSVAMELLILAVVFPQSSCSFWPFAHMSAVDVLEKKKMHKTFDLSLATNIIAFSLPFSTLLIMSICSTQQVFANPINVFIAGAFMLGMVFILRNSVVHKKQSAKSAADVTDTLVKEIATVDT